MKTSLSNKKDIKTILINFPTNIGDTVLALPVLDRLRFNYPLSTITAISSPKTKNFLLKNNCIDETIMFDKSWNGSQKKRFSFSLAGRYDAVIDLKNSFLPIIIRPKLRTPFVRKFAPNTHITDKYLTLIRKIAEKESPVKSDFLLDEKEKEKWNDLKLSPSVFIACFSRSSVKRYDAACLKEVVEKIVPQYPVIILGEEKERQYYKDVLDLSGTVDLLGKTQITDIFYLLKNYASLVLGVDSSILHIASYLNVPVVAIFGPTHPDRSRPRSDKSIVLLNEKAECIPCEKAKCAFNHECMKIPPDTVVKAVTHILEGLLKNSVET